MKSVALGLLVVLFVLAGCGQPVEGGLLIRTADPAVALFVPITEAEVGLAEPDPTLEPPCTLIKANISRDGRKLYHTPDSPNYDQVKIDEAAGERFFCDEQSAIDAGWTKAGG